MGPIDYSSQIVDPMTAQVRGLQLAAAGQQIQMEQQARQQALQQAQMQQQALKSLYVNPNAGYQDYARVAMMMPKDQAESIRKSWDVLDKGQQQSELSYNMQVMSALKANPQVGIDLLNQRAEAAKNGGQMDQYQVYNAMAQAAQNDPLAVANHVGILTAAIPGAKDALEGFTKIGGEQRSTELHPALVAKGQASAQKETSEANIKAVEAQYAPQEIKAKTDKLLAEIGLTKAQTNSAYASASNSAANAEKTRLEIGQMNSGVLPPEKQIEAAAKLRHEYTNNTKGFQEVNAAYKRIAASDDTAVGDLSMIFGYMKMLDPGSTVREGEFASASNAGGIDDKVRNVYNKVISGERLTAGQRNSFRGQAEKLYGAARDQEQVVRKGITGIANRVGINTQDVFYEPDTPANPGQTSSRGKSSDQILKELGLK